MFVCVGESVCVGVSVHLRVSVFVCHCVGVLVWRNAETLILFLFFIHLLLTLGCCRSVCSDFSWYFAPAFIHGGLIAHDGLSFKVALLVWWWQPCFSVK